MNLPYTSSKRSMYLTKCPFSFSYFVMPPLETFTPPPPGIRGGEYFTSGLFCLQRNHLAHEPFVTFFHGEELLAPRPTPKLEDHTLSAVRYCLFQVIHFPQVSPPKPSTHLCSPQNAEHFITERK